jgi:flagellar assembly factor FliW
MHIDSTRFGKIEIREDTVIAFPEGLIGLGGSRYALVARDDRSVFYWLHSIDDPSVALPVTMPWPFFADYEVKLADEDAAQLQLESPDQAEIFCVVRATDQLGDFTINLRGPIVIHSDRRLGRQVINEVGKYGVREPLFSRVPLSEVRPAAPAAPVAATGV